MSELPDIKFYETEPLRAEIDTLELLLREKDAVIAALRAELSELRPAIKH